MLARAKEWARGVKRDALAVWIAARDRRTPWPAKLLATAIAAYALSPIDLIPDFVPVLGYLDDLLILPLGIVLVVRMIPPDLMREFRAEAARLDQKPASAAGTIAIAILWLGLGALVLWTVWPMGLD
jgi:uncharacterized membrane protein YkvA (DUF1232 family)